MIILNRKITDNRTCPLYNTIHQSEGYGLILIIQ